MDAAARRQRSFAGAYFRVRGARWLTALLPLAVLTAFALSFRSLMSPWAFMGAMAVALFAGCKWLTYCEARARVAPVDRQRGIAYLFAWPGMDGEAFLSPTHTASRPSASEWIAAILRLFLGVTLTWVIARNALPDHPFAAGLLGMFGLVFVLHFGTFHLLSLAWRRAGIDAMPLMRSPWRATSLAEFWGRRWNTAFHELAWRFTFRPLRRLTGLTGASFAAFFASGLIHELVISVPARGGYGRPTAYFVIQAVGIVMERSAVGQRLGLSRGVRGWIFTLLVTAVPLPWLFPPLFIHNVVLPMLAALGAM
jgi:hypothetical protein